jgi:glycerophosphoryl diester phosphodiesterase
MAGDLGWLVARPIAHRGLHDAAKGIIENSLAAAPMATPWCSTTTRWTA